MFVWPHGEVTGSVHWADLADMVGRKDDPSITEAGWARLEALLAEHFEAGPQPEPEPADQAEDPDEPEPEVPETPAEPVRRGRRAARPEQED